MPPYRIPIAALMAGCALPAGAQQAAAVLQAGSAEVTELPLRSEEIYLVPPQFTYPMAALREEIEGRCTIAFTVDDAGVPQDILPICTHAIFVEPARSGVAATRVRMGGAIVPGRRMRLPISFRLAS